MMTERNETIAESIKIVKSAKKQKSYPLAILAQHAPLLAEEVERLQAELDNLKETKS